MKTPPAFGFFSATVSSPLIPNPKRDSALAYRRKALKASIVALKNKRREYATSYYARTRYGDTAAEHKSGHTSYVRISGYIDALAEMMAEWDE